MRNNEIRSGNAAEYRNTRSFRTLPQETAALSRRIVSPHTVDTAQTKHPKVRSITKHAATVPDRLPLVDTHYSAPSNTANDKASESPQDSNGEQTADTARTDEQKKEGKADTGIIPPIDPPTDGPRIASEVPEPRHTWDKIHELAKIPPQPEERAVVRQTHEQGVRGILEKNSEFIDGDMLPDTTVAASVSLSTLDGENSVDIYAEYTEKPDGNEVHYAVTFPNAPAPETRDTMLSYIRDSKGIIRKHVGSKASLNKMRAQIAPGEFPRTAVIEKREAENEQIHQTVALEIDYGFSDEVGSDELEYVLNLAHSAVPKIVNGSMLNTIHNGRIEGLPVGQADSENGATELTKYIKDFFVRYGHSASATYPLHLTINGPHGEELKYSTGFNTDNLPFVEIEYVDPLTERVITLDYIVSDSLLHTARTIQTYTSEQLVNEHETTALGDVEEARTIRNFLNKPWTTFDSNEWGE